MPIDTFGKYDLIDITPEDVTISAPERRARLIREDAALRPWLLGPAIQAFQFTRWERIKFKFKAVVEAWRNA